MDRRPTSPFGVKVTDATGNSTTIISTGTQVQSNQLTTTEIPTVRATIVDRKVTLEDVRKLGIESGKGIAAISAKVLEGHQNANSGEMGDKLNDIIKASKGMSTDNFQPGIVGKVLNKLSIMKYDATARFNTAKDTVDHLVEEFRKNSGRLVTIANSYDDMIKGNAEYRHNLINEIAEAEDMINSVANQMGTYTADQLTADEAQEYAELQMIHDELEKQIVNMEGFKALSTMMDPKLTAMKSSIYSLENTFQAVIFKMVPAYSLMFADYLNAQEAGKIAKIGEQAADTFDELIKKAGDESAKTMEAAARLRNRQMVSTETLKSEHEKMIASLNNVRAIEEQARADRAKAVVEIREIEAKTIAALTTRTETKKLSYTNSTGMK